MRVSFANASSPAVSDVSRTIARRSVVFPAPLGPASATRSPRRSRNETPSNNGSPENSFLSPDAVRTATAKDADGRLLGAARSRGAIALVGWARERRRLIELVGLLGLDSLKRRRIAAPR